MATEGVSVEGSTDGLGWAERVRRRRAIFVILLEEISPVVTLRGPSTAGSSENGCAACVWGGHAVGHRWRGGRRYCHLVLH